MIKNHNLKSSTQDGSFIYTFILKKEKGMIQFRSIATGISEAAVENKQDIYEKIEKQFRL